MYAERIEDIPAVRFTAIERQGVLTLWVTKADKATTVRGLALVGALVACATAAIVKYSVAAGWLPLLVAAQIGAGVFVLRSSLRYARDIASPGHSLLRRTCTSIEVTGRRLEGVSAAYRTGAAPGLTIDGEHFEFADMRGAIVLRLSTVENEQGSGVESVEYVSTVVTPEALFELERFKDVGRARELARVIAEACGVEHGEIRLLGCPSWNPYRLEGARGLVRLAELVLWVGGIVAAMLAWHALGIGAMASGLAVDVMFTRSEGRRMGALRTAMVRAGMTGREGGGDATEVIHDRVGEDRPAPKPDLSSKMPSQSEAVPLRTDVPVSRNDEAAPDGTLVPLKIGGIFALVAAGIFGLYEYGAFGGNLGDEVTRPEQCHSGIAVTTLDATRMVCSQPCEFGRACPDEFSCDDGHCIPNGRRQSGQACSAPWDCQSRTCLGIRPAWLAHVPDAGAEERSTRSGTCL